MLIDVLVCRPDGTQEFTQREVADDYFDAQPVAQEPTEIEQLGAELENALCEIDETNEARFTTIENALCELEIGG